MNSRDGCGCQAQLLFRGWRRGVNGEAHERIRGTTQKEGRGVPSVSRIGREWGMAAYKFPWYDADIWAYAEHYGLSELLSEDVEHGRKSGTVRARNPFLASALA